jgi:hypothetical protein
VRRPSKALARYQAAGAEVTRLWRLACLHDNIGTASQFVVFSKDNPFNAEYNAAVKESMRARKTWMAARNRAAKRDVLDSLGMKEVRGALGGRYIE